MKPYTYLVGWSKYNLYYYGVQYGNKAKPENLMNTYFTSSDYVHAMIKIAGLPDVVEIRKTFKDKISALNWEKTVLKRMGVPKNEKFLNRHYGGSEKFLMREGFTFAYDLEGNKHFVKTGDERFLTGELRGNRKNKLNVILISSGEMIEIQKSEFDRTIHRHFNEGRKRKNSKRKPWREQSRNYYDEDGNRIRMKNKEASEKGLMPVRSSQKLLRNSETGEIKTFESSDNYDKNVWVGLNKGRKFVNFKYPFAVCELETRKEFSLSNWKQHSERLERGEESYFINSVVCDLKTREHYDKAGWNRYVAAPRIDQKIENRFTWKFEKKRRKKKL